MYVFRLERIRGRMRYVLSSDTTPAAAPVQGIHSVLCDWASPASDNWSYDGNCYYSLLDSSNEYGWGAKNQFLTYSLLEKFLVIILFEMIRFTQLHNLGVQNRTKHFKISMKLLLQVASDIRK